MSNISVRKNLLLFTLVLVILQVVNCQWPQQKYDEFRTNRFNFRKTHASWDNGNICPSTDAVYFGDFKSSFVFSSKQGKGFGLVSDSKNLIKLIQVDLQTGLSTRVTQFPGLPASVSAAELTQGILSPSEVYVNVLSLNFSYPVIVKIDTLNNFKSEFKVLKIIQDGSIWDIAYSERHDILVICANTLTIGVKLSNLEIVWQIQNPFVSTSGNILLVPNEYNDGNDMLYYGSGSYVYRLRVLTGQATSQIFSNMKYSIVSMSYLGIPGWVTVASVDEEISGGDFLSVINVEKSFGVQSQILFHPWVANFGDCGSPTTNVTKVDSNNFVFDIQLICKDAKVRTQLIGITSKASLSGTIDIQVNYNIATDGYGLASIGNGVSVIKSNSNFWLVNKTGQLNKKISSQFENVQDCEIAASTNGKIYSICSNNDGSVSMESVDY